MGTWDARSLNKVRELEKCELVRVGDVRWERLALTMQRNMYFIIGAEFFPHLRGMTVLVIGCHVISRYCHDLQ
jgi:hypothetical protein